MVREFCGTLPRAKEFGYGIGKSRWERAGVVEKEPQRQRGRPNKTENKQLIALVDKAFAETSQPSSRLSWDPRAQEWMIVNTLTSDKKAVWQNWGSLQGNMSLSTFWRIAKKHLRHYKGAESINDYCIYCYDLKTKVLPQVKNLLDTVRKELEALMPAYFAPWDGFEAQAHLADKPGLHLRLLRHYIDHRSETQACREHRGTEWPCGLSRLRARGSGFAQRLRVTLHAKEVDICVQLQAMSKLLDSYLFHRSANEFQKPLLFQLLAEPPEGAVVILSDFKELVTLPIRSTQTGEEFFANARKDISVFGSIVSERAADGKVLWTRVLILSDILDHTSCRASQCIEQAFQSRRGTAPVEVVHLLSDAGPHFRSYEALHHYCCIMPLRHKARVCVHYGVEKHFKSEADRLFALFESYVKDARRQGKDLVEITDLCKFLQEKNLAQRQKDPTAPFLIVINDVLSKKQPVAERFRLTAKGFHITRTYCVSSAPAVHRHSRLGVKIFNHIFSNMAAANNLSSEAVLLPSKDASPEYRRGFWTEEGRRRWDHEVQPLGRTDETSLTRR
ncbi:unnamed protein product [Durusdinium trenchii]